MGTPVGGPRRPQMSPICVNSVKCKCLWISHDLHIYFTSVRKSKNLFGVQGVGFRVRCILNTPEVPACPWRAEAHPTSLWRYLDDTAVHEMLSPYMGRTEIKRLLGRRDRIVTYFQKKIEKEGEDRVLLDYPSVQ